MFKKVVQEGTLKFRTSVNFTQEIQNNLKQSEESLANLDLGVSRTHACPTSTLSHSRIKINIPREVLRRRRPNSGGPGAVNGCGSAISDGSYKAARLGDGRRGRSRPIGLATIAACRHGYQSNGSNPRQDGATRSAAGAPADVASLPARDGCPPTAAAPVLSSAD